MQARYGEAEPLARRALATYEQQFGPQSPETADALMRLDTILKLQGRNKDAEPLARRALAIDGIPGAFDRQAAYELYQALLGDASIQAVIRDKPLPLIVPSGALTTLPPGLLLTAPPAGGAAGDVDPQSLRATAWLLRSKAVALLPAVSSQATLAILDDDSIEAAEPAAWAPFTLIGEAAR